MPDEPKAVAKPFTKWTRKKWATLAVGIFCFGYAIADGGEQEVRHFLFFFLIVSWAVILFPLSEFVSSQSLIQNPILNWILNGVVCVLLLTPFWWIAAITNPPNFQLNGFGKPYNYTKLYGKDLQGIPGFFVEPYREGTRYTTNYPGKLEVEWGEVVAIYLEKPVLSREEALDRFRRGDQGKSASSTSMYESAENLWDAARGDRIRKADAFLKSGSDVNAADENGWTPLMCAARTSNNSRMLSLLLRAGANPHAESNEGKTALDYAKMSWRFKFSKSPGYKQLVNATLGFDAPSKKHQSGWEPGGGLPKEPEYEYLDRSSE